MLKVILKRIAIAIPVILIVASLTFFLVRMAPGGPFDAEKVVESIKCQFLILQSN